MLDNKNHRWPLVVSAERSRVTFCFWKGRLTAFSKISAPLCVRPTGTLEEREVFSGTRMSRQKTNFNLFCRYGDKTLRGSFMRAWTARCISFHTPRNNVERKRAVKWPPNKNSIAGTRLSCQFISVNLPGFLRVAQFPIGHFIQHCHLQGTRSCAII